MADGTRETEQVSGADNPKKRPSLHDEFNEAYKRARRDYFEPVSTKKQVSRTTPMLSAPTTPVGEQSVSLIPGLGNLPDKEPTSAQKGLSMKQEEYDTKTGEVDSKAGLGHVRDESSRSISGTTIYAGLTAAKRPSRPYAPPKKERRNPGKPEYEKIEMIDTRGTAKPQSFYDNVDMSQKVPRQDLITMQHIKVLIESCQKSTNPHGEPSPQEIMKLRTRLHQMEFYAFLTPVLVLKSKVLDDDVGLPQVFRNTKGVNFPSDIRADAECLYKRWRRGILDPHLLRGIKTDQRKKANTKTTTHRLDNSYSNGVPSCNVFGANNLTNGQWWPLQICARRDGGHGEIEAGIHGEKGRGAFSVVLSSGGYGDRDYGDRILYCGTSGAEGKPSAGTSRLLESYQSFLSGNPKSVRVIRTAKLSKENKHRPVKGLRYDGLYDVVGCETLDVGTAMHRFELERRSGQDPIRCSGVEQRPTNEELAEIENIRDLLGMGFS